MYEFSTIMAVAAVFAANFYNGLNTVSWNWWVLGGVLIGPVLIILYTAVYSAFPPTLIWTYVWGNNSFLWPSAYWWLTLLFTIVVSLAPRYFYRFISENYFPTNVDILRAIEKRDPNQCVFSFLSSPRIVAHLFLSHSDWTHDPSMPHPIDGPGAKFERTESSPESSSPIVDRQRPASIASHHGPVVRDSYQLGRVRTDRSMTHDMSTGRVTPGHGSGYAFDEGVNLDINRFTSRTSSFSQS